MITEDYCDFETSKLLKEKGFNTSEIDAYFPFVYYSDGKIDFYDDDKPSFVCEAVTLQMAMKWLREVHNKHICSFPVVTDDDGIMGYWWEDCIITDRRYNSVKTGKLYNSPEEAYEAAIKYCLTNLIK